MSVDIAELKTRLLKLLEEDTEFRYAVVGLIGLGEILRRLDRHEEELVRIREEQKRVWEEIARLWNEIARLREDMVKGFERHDMELAKLREDLNRLREDFNRAIQLFEKRFEEIDKRFEDIDRRFEAVDRRFAVIEERLDKMDARLGRVEPRLDNVEIRLAKVEESLSDMNVRLSNVERALEKLTLDIEEEARSIIRYRLRNELGIDIEITSLHLPDTEINIYGCRDDICIVGEASVRAGTSVLEKLENDIEILKKKYPDKLKPKTILVIYTSLAMPELVREAEKRGIWVLKATGDIYRPDLSKILS